MSAAATTHVGLLHPAAVVGNFLGPLTLRRRSDVVGRRPMIAGSYIAFGVLLAITGSIVQ